MEAKPIILVDGLQSAQFLVDNFKNTKAKKWIVCDARAGQILGEHAIAYDGYDFYFQDAKEALIEAERTAYRLSLEWFSQLNSTASPDTDFRPEMAFTLPFFYFALVILRAFNFLEQIQRKEGGSLLWATRSFFPKEMRESFRWQKNESPVPALLEACNKSWGFDLRLFDIPSHGYVERGIHFSGSLTKLASSFTQATRKGKILFSGNPFLLGPIEQELRERYGMNCLRVRQILKAKELALICNPRWVLVENPAYAQKPSDVFNEAACLAELRKSNVFFINGTDFLPVFWGKIRNFYRWEAPHAVALYRRIKRLLERLQPEYVIVDEDWLEFNRILVYVASTLEIKTLIVQHGLTGTAPGFVPLTADHIAVWGAQSYGMLESYGLSAERMVVTGCPKYDRLCNFKEDPAFTKRVLCRNFGWDPAKPLVLVTPDNFRPNGFERCESLNSTADEVLKTAIYFFRIASLVPNINIIFKFHGGVMDSEVYDRLEKNLGGLPDNFKWFTQGLAHEILNGCDLLFNSISSAGLEAALLKKPVVDMNYSARPDIYSFRAHGLNEMVTTFEETLKVCQGLAAGKLPLARWINSQECLVETVLFSRDGRAAQRVGNFIKKRMDA